MKRAVLILVAGLCLSGASFNDVDVTSTATKIVGANSARRSIIIQNLGSADIFIGHDDTVTTTDALELESNERYTEGGTNVWKGDIFGITASGTQDVRFWER